MFVPMTSHWVDYLENWIPSDKGKACAKFYFYKFYQSTLLLKINFTVLFLLDVKLDVKWDLYQY